MTFDKNFYLDSRRVYSATFSSRTPTPFYLLNQTSFCLITNPMHYFTQHYHVSKNLWSKFFILFKLDTPYRLPYVVDGIQFATPGNVWIVQFNLNTMLTDERTTVHTSVKPSSFYIPTSSTAFKSCVWLERELSDFTNINFLGLTDTRRLLLDYFESKQVWSTHVSNDKNFNNTLYDVCLSY